MCVCIGDCIGVCGEQHHSWIFALVAAVVCVCVLADNITLKYSGVCSYVCSYLCVENKNKDRERSKYNMSCIVTNISNLIPHTNTTLSSSSLSSSSSSLLLHPILYTLLTTHLWNSCDYEKLWASRMLLWILLLKTNSTTYPRFFRYITYVEDDRRKLISGFVVGILNCYVEMHVGSADVVFPA